MDLSGITRGPGGGGGATVSVNVQTPRVIQSSGQGQMIQCDVGASAPITITPDVNSFGHMAYHTDFNNIQAPTSTNMPGMTEKVIKAMLFIFSPKINYDHMVRPHVYNFNDQSALEAIQGSFHQGNEMVSRTMINQVPSVLEAIMPAKQGHVVKLNNLSGSHTFMLVVETMGAASMVSYMSTPIFKNISVGYFIDEPLGVNGSVNPRCEMKFTHHQRFQARKASETQMMNTMVNKQSHDVIPSEFRDMNFDPMTGLPSLVKMTPNHMRSVPAVAMSQIQILGNSASVLNNMIQPVIGAHDPVSIGSDIRYTPSHLRKLTDNLKTAGEVTNGNTIFNGYTEHSRMRGENLTDTFYNMLHSGDILITNGIGTWDKKWLWQVMTEDLPMLEVCPMDIKNPRQWDVYNSVQNNSRNQYHAWIGDMVTQACENVGITEISFHFSSIQGNQFEREGRWQLVNGLFQTIFGNSHALVNKAFFEFKGLLENDLFFILKNTIGEFTLSVNYNTYSATVVNLIMHDYNDNIKGVYYEHPTQFGGLVNPNIGSSNQFISNCLELQNLVNVLEMGDIQHGY